MSIQVDESSKVLAVLCDDTTNCFVCEEGGDLLRVCRCTGRWLHLHCQQELMVRMSTHRHGCPVCNSPYSNAQCVILRNTLTREGRRLFCYIIGVVSVFLIAMYELVMWCSQRHLGFLIVSMIFLVNSICFATVGFFVFRKVTLFSAAACEVRLRRPNHPTISGPAESPSTAQSITHQ